MAMSMKSTSPEMTTAAPVAVMTDCVPSVPPWTSSLFTPCVVLPPRVSVPVIVTPLKAILTPSVFTAVPVRV
jgi:hypothetical protein